jgi:hypothetical protein
MPFQPDKITKEHVLQAIQRIEKDGLSLKPSTVFDVYINDKPYPPKEVMRYAHQEMNGEALWKLKGGGPTNRYLRGFGFTVKNKNFGRPLNVQTRYWWVNQEQEYSLKDNPNLLTAPNDNVFHHRVMKEMKIGDYVLHYRRGAIVAASNVVETFNVIAKSDGEFLTLRVKFRTIDFPIEMDRIREVLHEYPDILPDKYAPINISTMDVRPGYLFPFTEKGYKILIEGDYGEDEDENMDEDSTMKEVTLNTILYGPPGTGKTFNTINKSIAIANPQFNLVTKTRAEVKSEYDRLYAAGRINFVTFHQNLSYEDFIEGIKPQTLNDQVVYEVEDGLFKAFCNKARFINGNFDDVIERFKKDISEADGNEPLRITASGTTFDIVYRGTNVFYVQPLNSVKENPWYPVNIENIRKAFETDSYEKIYNPTYVREVITHLRKRYGLVKGNSTAIGQKENYVFIIDEINRGNVSQIFGELITLIEPDKREDSSEALKIQLPYSKESFSVPDNVYILGTMNTADRSVEALDTALRRRFSFEFMPPKADLLANRSVGGIGLKRLLDVLNERITYLLDEDHQIGHAYFYSMPDTTEGVRLVFKNKIIPLLREYFFNDHAKIRLVLGDGFVKKRAAKPPFAVSDEDDLIVDKTSYQIVEAGDDFDIVSALRGTIGG